jgi:origin recognition complex subunit 6
MVPKWIQPVIRLLCKDLETPRAAPHIIAGVETILTLPSPSSLLASTPSLKQKSSPGRGEITGKIPALIASVWFFVVVRMRGKQQQGKETMERKRLVRESLARARSDEGVLKKVGKGDELWVGWELVEERDVNAWRREIVEKGWKEMDWFENLVEGCGVDFDVNEESANSVVEDMDEDEATSQEMAVVKENRKEEKGVRKLATLQDKYDYLNEDKQREYQEWRHSMLAKVNELMKEAMMDDGDVEMN